MGRIEVCAVIVTYNPDLEVLDRLLERLVAQVSEIVIVDNGSTRDIGAWLDEKQRPGCELQALGVNRGIAAAQNIGIELAIKRDASYVILFDQDSLPGTDMIARLVGAAEMLLASGSKLAAVGPRYLDRRQNNPPPFIRVRALRVERLDCVDMTTVVEVDYLVASGCFIPTSTLKVVGGMREELFIDYVDIEWGLRARRYGFKSHGVCAAEMEHSLGEEPIVFCGRRIPVHSPLRHYYHFRNAVWLYKQKWVPVNWRMTDAFRLIRKYVFYSLFAKPRLQHAKMMSLGISHGLVSRMGKIG